MIRSYITIGGLIIVPLLAMILPAGFFDHGQSICLSVLLFDRTCPGCGMSRALMHLVHGDFSIAYSYNKLVVVVFPLLLVLWYQEFTRHLGIIRKEKKSREIPEADRKD